jgi:hypothetical protein
MTRPKRKIKETKMPIINYNHIDLIYNDLNKEFKFTETVNTDNWLSKAWFDIVNQRDTTIIHSAFVNLLGVDQDIELWLDKTISEARKGLTVAALIRAETSSNWWHELVMSVAHEVRLIKGQIEYVNFLNCAVVIYRRFRPDVTALKSMVIN